MIDSHYCKSSYLASLTLSVDNRISHTVLWRFDDGRVSFMNLSVLLDYLDWGILKD